MQLHKRDVLAKATEILDRYGIADLTMRRLARELDVSPGALYWHFANKQELLGAVADEVLAPACVAPPAADSVVGGPLDESAGSVVGGPLTRGTAPLDESADSVVGGPLTRGTAPLDESAGWRTRMTHIAVRLRDALLSHTDGAELASASFAAGQSAAVRQIVDRLSAAAAEAGLAGDQPALAARTVVYYVLGFTADEQSRLQWDAAGAALPDGQSALADDAGARFAFGLGLLLDGLAVRGGVVAR